MRNGSTQSFRSIATVNYGTNNDAGPQTWPTTVPKSSATVLVSQTSYKGEAEDQTDPAGQVTRTTFDAAGRVTSTTQNCGSSPAEVVNMTYNPASQLATFTAVNSDTGNEEKTA